MMKLFSIHDSHIASILSVLSSLKGYLGQQSKGFILIGTPFLYEAVDQDFLFLDVGN